jgi:hypothetical protein
MTYTVTSFGKAFAHVRNCLLKKAHVINKNIDGDYIFLEKKTDMKFIILVSNLKEISPSVFSLKKKIYKKNN